MTEIKVFKFGGASVKNADAACNVVSILKKFTDERILVVVSAMGKTTNLLEKLTDACVNKSDDADVILNDVRNYHTDILNLLFDDKSHSVFREVNNLFVEIEWVLEEKQERSYDFVYDQIVSVGELLSSKILSALLNISGIPCLWMDARDCVCTDNTYREGRIEWEATKERTKELAGLKFGACNMVLTQGFIGSTSENYTTTLGREGSDYSAAIFAYCLDANEMVIWKDVPGVLNADPKYFPDSKLLDDVSYQDAIELAYYGASVIHPKTIQPLQNKNIPLYVKSFLNPLAKGTLVSDKRISKPDIPSFIFKDNQALISVSAKDFSFIIEENLSDIFSRLAFHKIKINLMQNSAISFSVCVDNQQEKISRLMDDLRTKYKVLFNDHLILYTIRHYDQQTIEKLSKDKSILVEQRSRQTIQLLIKAN